MVNKEMFFKWLGLALFGFIGIGGGLISSCYFVGYQKNIIIPDAISTANTYIVYTTFIFVGFSVLLVIGSLMFAQQFAQAKEEQTIHLLNELKSDLKNNKNGISLELIATAIENEEIKSYIKGKLEGKIIQLVNETDDGSIVSLAQSINGSSQKKGD